MGFSQWKAPAGYPRAEGEQGCIFIAPAPFLKNLSQNPQILSGSPLYIALDPGTVPSPIPSILGAEMTPDVANFVLVSLNPANTLVNNTFTKLSSNYPT